MDDLYLVTVGEQVKSWRTVGGKWSLIDQIPFNDGGSQSINWSPDNRYLAGCCYTRDKIIVKRFPFGSEDDIVISGEECVGKTCLSFSSSNLLLAGDKNGLIHVWDIRNQKLIETHKIARFKQNFRSPVTSLQSNHQGSTVAAGFGNGYVVIYRIKAGTTAAILVSKNSSISCLRFSPHKNGNVLAASCTDGTVHLLDALNKRLVHSYAEKHVASTTSIIFSPLNSSLMLTVGLDKKLICFNIDAKTVLKEISFHEPLESIDFHHNGRIVAVGTTTGKVFFYNLKNGDVTPLNIAAHTSLVHCLKFINMDPKNLKEKAKAGDKQVLYPVSENTQQEKDSIEFVTKTDSIYDIFSPYKNEDLLETESSFKHSIDTLLRDSLPAQSLASSSSGFSSSIFSPLASSASHSHCEPCVTPVKLEAQHGEMFPNSPRALSYTPQDVKEKQAGDIPETLTESINDTNAIRPSRLRDERPAETLREVVKENLVGASGTTSENPVGSVSVELMRRIFRDEVWDFCEQMHRGVVSLHMEMIKKFCEQQMAMEKLVQSFSREALLAEEVKLLREENARLKKHFN